MLKYKTKKEAELDYFRQEIKDSYYAIQIKLEHDLEELLDSINESPELDTDDYWKIKVEEWLRDVANR